MSRYFCELVPKPAELRGAIVKKPQRATSCSAGYDIYAPFTFVLLPGEERTIPTGLGVHMNPDEFLAIYPRSGLGFWYYTRLANTVGIIDSDYEKADNGGHIKIKIRNESEDNVLEIQQGEAFCQAVFQKYLLVDGDDVNTGSERTGGFGSTTKGRKE